jgi:O-antigen/teichoic acid export membrane protein
MKKSNRIIILNILSTVIIQGLNFLASPIFSRLLGTENYGVVSLYNTWTMIITAVFSLQVGSTLQIARNRFPLEDQDKYQSSVLSFGSVNYLLFSLLVFLFLNQISGVIKMEKTLILVMIIHSYGQFCLHFANSKYTYEFKAGRNFVLSVVTSVFSIGLSVFLIYKLPEETNYWGRILGNAVTYALMGLVAWLLIFPKGRVFFKAEYWRFALPLGLPLILHSLSGLILSQSDRVMLQHMGTEAMVGIYSLAFSFSTVLNVIWNALNNSWVPYYFEYTRTGNIEEMKQRARNYLELFTVLSTGFVLLSPEVYHIFADSRFWEGTKVVPLLAVGYYMVFLYSFPVNFEFFHQKNKFIAVTTVAAALCNILLNYFFIRWWGFLGAALATAIAHGLQFVFHYISARFLIGRKDFPFSFGLLMEYAIPFLVISIFCTCTDGFALVRWAVGAVLGIWELYRVYRRKKIF